MTGVHGVTFAARLFGIRPGEARAIAPVTVLMFVAVGGLTLGDSAIGALFFDRVGAEALPRLYLAQGAVGLVGMVALTAALGRFDRRRTYVSLPALLAILVAVERAILGADPTWIYAAMWLTVTIANLLQAVFLWGTAGLVTDTRRAKRLFPLFGAATILGAVVGGVATRPLAAVIGVENLLVVWAIALLASSGLVAAIVRVGRPGRRGATAGWRSRARQRRTSTLRELSQGLAFVRRSPLLVWMAVASVLFSLLFYSLYLPYAQAAAERFPDPDELAGFFGIFWAGVTVGAFVVSLLVTNRLLAWIGAASVVLVLPVLYAGAFVALLVTTAFQVLVALRFGVGVWLQGASSPAWEALVNVTPEQRRDQVRAFLNGGPAQVGTAIAGVVQIVGQDALSARQLSTIGLAVAALTIVVCWRIRGSYTSALVDAIRAGRPIVFDVGVPDSPIPIRTDGQALELAASTMVNPDPRIRRLGAELLATADDERAAETLRAALRDADALVRATAIGALAARGDLREGELDAALADEDAMVRLTLARTGATPIRLLADPVAAVAAAAAGRLLGGPSEREALATIEPLVTASDAQVRLAAVRELRAVSSTPYLTSLIAPLAEDRSYPVRAAALETLSSWSAEAAGPAALSALAAEDPELRRAALSALDALGPRSLDAELEQLIVAHASMAERDRSLASAVPADGDVADLLRSALLERGRRNAVVALCALSVESADRDGMRLALDNLADLEPAQVANALEAIESAAGPHAVRGLIALWEPPAAAPARDGRDALADVLEDDDPLIRACAELVWSRLQGGAMNTTSMSMVERVLVLRKIPLFATLTATELQRVAEIAEERSYADGDVLAAEGEIGDEMHIVLDGTVRVERATGGTVARRGPGDVVGEMSIITRSPRVASVVADGDVRAVRIDQRRFEAMVRERPEIALAVMRVLAERIAALTSERG